MLHWCTAFILERVQQLEETIGVLEQEQAEATDAIALWESRCQDLEEAANNSNCQSFEEKSELSSQIDTLKTEIEMYEKSIKEHADAIEKLQAAVNERDEAISTSENEYGDALKQWQGKHSFHFVFCEKDWIFEMYMIYIIIPYVKSCYIDVLRLF